MKIDELLPVGTVFQHIETFSNYPVYWSISLGVYERDNGSRALVLVDFTGGRVEYGFQRGSYMDRCAEKCFKVIE